MAQKRRLCGLVMVLPPVTCLPGANLGTGGGPHHGPNLSRPFFSLVLALLDSVMLIYNCTEWL